LHGISWIIYENKLLPPYGSIKPCVRSAASVKELRVDLKTVIIRLLRKIVYFRC